MRYDSYLTNAIIEQISKNLITVQITEITYIILEIEKKNSLTILEKILMS